MQKPAVFAAALALSALAACTDNSVSLVSADKLTQFKPGSTNQTEVVAALGKPLHTIVEADGTKVDQYAAEAGSSGGGMMPSWLVGGSPQSYKMISFQYTSGGTLKDIKTN